MILDLLMIVLAYCLVKYEMELLVISKEISGITKHVFSWNKVIFVSENIEHCFITHKLFSKYVDTYSRRNRERVKFSDKILFLRDSSDIINFLDFCYEERLIKII
jgi:hypothetical protein